MPSTRRTFLAGAAAALAGCVSGRRDQGSSGDVPSPTRTGPPADQTLDFGEVATVGELDVTPLEATVQHSYFSLVYPDFADVVGAGGGQILFVTADVSGTADAPAPGASDFSIVTADGTFFGRSETGPGRPYREGPAYTRDRERGWILFELPAPTGGDRSTLELDHGDVNGGGTATWRLPADLTAALQRPPPEFEVRAFSAPDTVRPDEPIEVSATVANVGEGAGTFRASLNQEGDLLYGADPFSFDLESGAERAWTETVTTHQGGEIEGRVTVRIRFRSAGGDYDQDVVVRPPGTTTE